MPLANGLLHCACPAVNLNCPVSGVARLADPSTFELDSLPHQWGEEEGGETMGE